MRFYKFDCRATELHIILGDLLKEVTSPVWTRFLDLWLLDVVAYASGPLSRQARPLYSICLQNIKLIVCIELWVQSPCSYCPRNVRIAIHLELLPHDFPLTPIQICQPYMLQLEFSNLEFLLAILQIYQNFMLESLRSREIG